MRTVIGVLTENFRLYHDLVAELKAQGVPFQSLAYGRPIPSRVGVILTSPDERPRVAFRAVVAAGDVREAVAKARQMLRGRLAWKELVVGVDPGATPGVAVVGDGEVIETRRAARPEAVASMVRSVVRAYPADRVRIRIGHQDPTNRNRIINALARDALPVEIVNEEGTTTRSPHSDLDAAVRIAFTRGERAERRYAVVPTGGEIRDIQRRSRLASGGILTISKPLAREVAQGRLSLEEAIERQRRTPHSSRNRA
jgi:hypothetical protein